MNRKVIKNNRRQTYYPSVFILFCALFSWLGAGNIQAIAERGVRQLALHQVESSLVTQAEMDLVNDWVTALSSKQAPAQHDWFNGWLSSSIPFAFTYAESTSSMFLHDWDFDAKKVETTDAYERKELRWTDPRTQLEVVCELKQFSKFPAVEWILRFMNKGTVDTPIIQDIHALNLSLKHGKNGAGYTVYAAQGGRTESDDMMPFTWQNKKGAHGETLSIGGSTSSNKHLPFWNIETPESCGVMVGMGWTGFWQADMVVQDNLMQARAGMMKAHFVLHPNEQVRSPRVLLVFWEGKRLHGHNMFRQVLYKHYLHPLKGELQKPLATVNTCFTYHGKGGYLTQATADTLVPLIEPFIKLGAEAWVIDAGWYITDGNWTKWKSFDIEPKRYPDGFRPISEPLQKAGIPFGLWFASEWMGPFYDADKCAAFLAYIDRYTKEELLSMYRQDGGAHYPGDEPNRVGINEIKHYEGLYEVWDQIIQRHPEIIMEGCCGGGRRIDLETIQRFSWIQKSDRWFDSESDQCSLYGGNLFLPGGVLNLPTQAVDDYGCWSSFGGQFCLAWHPLDKDFPMEKARRQVELYKQVRHLLSGDYYPLTKCSLEEPWIGYQFHRQDLDEGLVLLFRRRCPYSMMDVSLRGLDPQAKYQLDFKGIGQQKVYSGKELNEAFAVQITQSPGAELIIYRR